MSITDELREWWVRKFPVMDKELHKDFTAIADRIDAEHEQQMAERRKSCVFYDAERNYCKVHDEGDMAELGYVRLPVDADGEPIHIGDVMEWVRYGDDDKTIVCEVSGVGVEVFFAWSDEQGRYAQYEAHAYRHYHEPTIEDVLREFANEVYADADNEIRDRDFLCAKYAKRLTLAEGEDE